MEQLRLHKDKLEYPVCLNMGNCDERKWFSLENCKGCGYLAKTNTDVINIKNYIEKNTINYGKKTNY